MDVQVIASMLSSLEPDQASARIPTKGWCVDNMQRARRILIMVGDLKCEGEGITIKRAAVH